METKALISVIIPVYNVEKYLEECVQSVLSQTYENFEVILVDDGSTDKSGKICDAYAQKDTRISVIHQENMGQAIARNIGLQKVCGDYVYFLDSDDWIETTMFEVVVKEAIDKNADLVFFDALSFDDDTGEKSVRQSYIKKNKYDTGEGKKVFEKMQENKEFSNAIPLTFLKFEFLKKNQLKYVPGITMEDILFSFQIFNTAKIVHQVKEVLYHRRYRTGSVTKSIKTISHFKSSCIIYYELLDFVEKNSLHGKASNIYIARSAYNTLNLYSGLTYTNRKNVKSDYRKLRNDIKKNNSFGQKALSARCYGKIPWAVVKVWERLFKNNP